MFKNPNRFLLISVVLLVILSFFSYHKTLDLHIHDTYFVISLNSIYWTLALIQFLFILVYWWSGNILLSSFLTWTHVVFTLSLVCFVITAPYWIPWFEQSFHRDPYKAIEQRMKFNRAVNLVGLLLIIGQLVFFVNLIGGAIKRYSRN